MIQPNAPNLIILFGVLVVGFVAGHLYSGQRKQKQQEPQRHGYSHSRGGKKRRARIRKSEDKRETKATGLKKSSLSSSVQGNPDELSRGTRKRNKNVSPKDMALDAFVEVARTHVECIGAGDYESLLLVPKATFIAAGRFLSYMECRERLVNLGQARTAMTGVHEQRVLYVSCSWWGTSSDKRDWDARDFETTRAFLERNPDVVYVYVGGSCMVNDSRHPLNDSQLWHVPCVLLRADYMLILPRPSTELAGETDVSTSEGQPHSDFRSYAREAWARMELSLAAVGQAKVHVAFRAGPYLESMCELETSSGGIRDMVKKVVDVLRAAAASSGVGMANAMADNVSLGIDAAAKDGAAGNGRERGSEILTAAVRMACDNWLGSDINPLKALEEARAFVTAAEKDGKIDVLETIRSMPPTTPSDDPMAGVRTALGEEYRKGSRQLALYFLVVSVLCTKPKERGTYTDAFVDAAAEMDITYRPIALVRSPYRERFGTPRQPQVTASVLLGGAQEGQIVFLKGHGFEEALQDLDGFDMIWVISHMHLNNGWNRKVRPPRLPEERKGLFSTRSPHRPNPVALSSLRVKRVDAARGVIYVQGLDLLDGTPVLDVKPYIGYCDAFPDMKAGWLDTLGSDHEDQGDFLSRFSVGAALVHTEDSSQVDEAPSSVISSNQPEEASLPGLQRLERVRRP